MKTLTIIALVVFSCSVASAQKRITENDGKFRNKAGYSFSSFANNQHYGYTVMEPQNSVGSVPHFLIKYDIAADSYSSQKINTENKLFGFNSIIAYQDKVNIIYKGRSKETKNFGVFAAEFDLNGKLLQDKTLMEVDSRSDMWDADVVNSPDNNYTLVQYKNRLLLFNNQTMEVLHDENYRGKEILDYQVGNDGKSILLYTEGGASSWDILSKEGNVLASSSFKIPTNTYDLEIRYKPEADLIYVVCLQGENTSFRNFENRYEASSMYIFTYNATKLDLLNTETESFDKPIEWLRVSELYKVDNDAILILTPRYTRIVKGDKVTSYIDVSEDLYFYKLNNGKIAGDFVIKRHIDGSFNNLNNFMVTPYVTKINNEVFLMYHQDEPTSRVRSDGTLVSGLLDMRAFTFKEELKHKGAYNYFNMLEISRGTYLAIDVNTLSLRPSLVSKVMRF